MKTISNRTTLFEQVSDDYQHNQKWVQPAPALVTPDTYLKWYLIYPGSLPITSDQIDDAQTFINSEIEAGRLALRNEVGFVVQHRCAEVIILYVCTWRGNNEVWETLYRKETNPEAHYKVIERVNTSPTFCVWVLSAVLHEQKSWTHYLQSQRDETAEQIYLNDQMTGWV